METIERTINAERIEQLIDVFGSFDENIKRIEAEFSVRITNRGTELKIQGDVEAADAAARAIEALMSLAAKGEEIDEQKVRYILGLVRTGNEAEVSKIARDVVCVSAKGRPIKAKTIGLPRKDRQQDHPDTPRSRGGRAAGLPARRPSEQGRSLSPSAL